jgi:hypothetical protein
MQTPPNSQQSSSQSNKKGMQVPEHMIESFFDDLKEISNNSSESTPDKMQFYSDIELMNKTELKDLNKRHESDSYDTNHSSTPGVPIYVDKTEWKKYIQLRKENIKKKDEVKPKKPDELFSKLTTKQQELINTYTSQIESENAENLDYEAAGLVETVRKIVDNQPALDYLLKTDYKFNSAHYKMKSDIVNICKYLVYLYYADDMSTPFKLDP